MVQQVVGDLAEHGVGVDVEAGLRAVPPRVAELRHGFAMPEGHWRRGYLVSLLPWAFPRGSGGARARRPRSAKVPRRRPTGRGGRSSGELRSPATATASAPATPRTSRCSRSTGSPITACRSSGPASSPARRARQRGHRALPVDPRGRTRRRHRAVGVPASLHVAGLVRRRPRRLPRREGGPLLVAPTRRLHRRDVRRPRVRMEADQRARRVRAHQLSDGRLSSGPQATSTTSAPWCATSTWPTPMPRSCCAARMRRWPRSTTCRRSTPPTPVGRGPATGGAHRRHGVGLVGRARAPRPVRSHRVLVLRGNRGARRRHASAVSARRQGRTDGLRAVEPGASARCCTASPRSIRTSRS